MTTETAQRRLLEALAELHKTRRTDIGEAADPLAAMLAGVRQAADWTTDLGEPGMAGIYAALGDLIETVRTDLKEPTNG